MDSQERALQLHWSHSERRIAHETAGRNSSTPILRQQPQPKPISNALRRPSKQPLFEDGLKLGAADGRRSRTVCIPRSASGRLVQVMRTPTRAARGGVQLVLLGRVRAGAVRALVQFDAFVRR
jgi:hypothetical protein